jgi:hypothetical protein
MRTLTASIMTGSDLSLCAHNSLSLGCHLRLDYQVGEFLALLARGHGYSRARSVRLPEPTADKGTITVEREVGVAIEGVECRLWAAHVTPCLRNLIVLYSQKSAPT